MRRVLISNRALAIRRAPSARAANDNAPQTDIPSENLVARAIVIFAAISLLSSLLLVVEMFFTAGPFGVPEFTQHPWMELLMAGVLGAGAAGWFLIRSLCGHAAR